MSAETAMRFPAWREVKDGKAGRGRSKTPNTRVIGEVVKLITVPYSGTEPATQVVVRPPLSDYAELPVDV